MNTSTDGGAHFAHGSVADSRIVPTQRVMLIFTVPPPTIAVDASDRVFVAWSDARNGDWDVFMRRSTDGGHTWEHPVRLNDDALQDGRNQHMPQLSVAPSGRVDAIFYDRRSNVENRGSAHVHHGQGTVHLRGDIERRRTMVATVDRARRRKSLSSPPCWVRRGPRGG